MKRRLIAIICLFMALPGFATLQMPDMIIYKGEELSLLGFPLEQLEGFEIEESFNGFSISSACWRGYIAHWSIEGDQLYLNAIRSWDRENPVYADLSEIFGDKCRGGKVEADWFTGTVRAGKERMLHQTAGIADYYFQYEYELTFENGRLQNVQIYDNSKARTSKYANSNKELMGFIRENIRWEGLPELAGDVRVMVRFFGNDEGVVDYAEWVGYSYTDSRTGERISRAKSDYTDVFIEEAIRVVKSIPEWEVFIKKGRLVRNPVVVPVNFRKVDQPAR